MTFKFYLKDNRKYLIVFVLCLLIMFYGLIENTNLIYILNRAFFEPGYRENYFRVQEIESLRTIKPTIINIIKYTIFTNAQYQFDTSIIFATVWFQVLLSFFAGISGITFYRSYHSRLNFEYYRKKAYRAVLVKEIAINAFKLSISFFLAYFTFLIFVKMISIPNQLGADGRSMFADIIGNSLYQENTLLYFVLEGLVRFLLMPFVYAFFAQSIVLLDRSLKIVIVAPILYFFGLSAISAAFSRIAMGYYVYFNPTVIMSSGDFNFNTFLLISTSMIPLYIGLAITFWRTRHVEI